MESGPRAASWNSAWLRLGEKKSNKGSRKTWSPGSCIRRRAPLITSKVAVVGRGGLRVDSWISQCRGHGHSDKSKFDAAYEQRLS